MVKLKRGRPPTLAIITDRDRKIATELLSGKPIYQALKANGVSENYARRGQGALTKGIRAALMEQGTKFDWMGERLLNNPKLIESSVVGWLYQSMIDRNSKGVAAAKLLGSHKSVDMFVKEGQQNQVLVINAPAEFSGLEPKTLKPNPPKALPPSQAPDVDYE